MKRSAPESGASAQRTATKRQRVDDDYVYTDQKLLARRAALAVVEGIHEFDNDEVGEVMHILGLDEQIVPEEFQLRGIRFLLTKYKESLKPDASRGCILADEMGLGKTLQTLCLMRAALLRKGGPIIVITPKSVTQNWVAEIGRFFGHATMRVLHYHGTNNGWSSYTRNGGKPVKSKTQPMTADIRRHDVVLTHHDAIAALWNKEVAAAADEQLKKTGVVQEQDRIKKLPPGAPWYMHVQKRPKVEKQSKRPTKQPTPREKLALTKRAQTLVFESAHLGEGKLTKKVARFTEASSGLFSPLLTTRYSVIAVDEAHAFRNPDTLRFKSHTMLRGAFFVAITGTPIINARSDTWALLKFMHAPNLCTLYDFQRSEKKAEQHRRRQEEDEIALQAGVISYPKYLRRKKNRRRTQMAQATDYLQEIMGTHMHRTSKADLYTGPAPKAPRRGEKLHTVGFGSVPHSWESEICVDMKPAAIALCECIADGAQQVIESATTQQERFKACADLLAMVNLKRVVSESAFVATDGLKRYCPKPLLDAAKNELHAKQDAVLSYMFLHVKPDEKMVLFANFEGGVEETYHTASSNGIGVVKITGATPQTERAAIIQRFHEQRKLRLLVCTHCLSHGVNITCANHVGFLSPWWQSKEEEQCAARVHRMGQEREIHIVYFIVGGDSVEKRVRAVAAGKNKVSKLTFDALASMAVM